MHIAVRVSAAGRRGEDRAAAIACEQGHLLLVVDGAGGRSGGAAAADSVLQAAQDLAGQQPPSDWAAWLEDRDQQLLNVGETTAVVAFYAHGRVCGASVGDSGAWLIKPMGYVNLTEHQRRKPLLGSTRALAVAFGPVTLDIGRDCPCSTRLLLASDGLFKYVPHDHIQRLVRTLPIDAAAAALVEAARLLSGALHDDIAVIIAG